MRITTRSVWQLLLALFLSCGWIGCAQAQIQVPQLSGRVVDQTDSLSAGEIVALNQILAQFEAEKGTQIAVLVVASTAPESIEQTALRVAERWQLGRKKIDDGAILLIAKEDRAVRIEVGYGLEGALNDATAKRIIEQYITPEFRKENYYAGINRGIEQMIRIAQGEPLPPVSSRSDSNAPALGQYVPIIFMLALVIGGVLRSLLGRMLGALVTGGVVALVAWFVIGTLIMAIIAGAIALLVTLFGGGVGGLVGGGGFGGTSTRSGGSFGGGFSGGGGSFGGGGASGRW